MDLTGQKQELKLYSQYALSSVKLSGIEGGKGTNMLIVVLISYNWRFLFSCPSLWFLIF